MSVELQYLAWAALLTAVLWIPYIVCQARTNGVLKAPQYTDPTPRAVPPWGIRANRAHINAVESFAPFAALILIIHVTGSSTAMTAVWAAVYFWSRLAYSVIYLIGIPYVRTAVFALSFVAVLGLFWELML